MEKLISRKNKSCIFLSAAFFLLVISQAIGIQSDTLKTIAEYSGLLLLAYQLMLNQVRKKLFQKRTVYCIIVFFGMTIGLILQKMTIAITIKALVPAILFSMLFTMSDGIINDLRSLKIISYSIICALFVAFGIAVIRGVALFEENGLGGRFYIGFNGGILYKNYYSATVLAAFMGVFIPSKYRRGFRNEIRPAHVIMTVLLALIFMASSNGTYLIMLSFLVTLYTVECFRKVKRSDRRVAVFGICAIGFISFVILFNVVALKNQNYLYRLNGLIYYIRKYKRDWFHLLFGNGELAYAPGESYVQNIRSVIGEDGTLELSWLGILIKNGLFGVVVYLIVFGRMIFKAFKQKNWKVKALSFAVIVAMLVSSLVETYIQNVHVIFGIYMFLLAFSCDAFRENNR